MKTQSVVENLAIGAAAGLVGTVLMQQVRGLSQQLHVPKPPMQEEPGQFMVERAKSALPQVAQEKVPDAAETAAAQSLAFGYGATFGALYGSLCPRGGNRMVHGAALGIVTWAAGYLGWLPALGLMPPLSTQEPAQVAGPIMQHVLFGIATVAAYDALRRLAR